MESDLTIESRDACLQHATASDLYLRIIALFGIVLVISTWRLWLPQSLFPQIPVFGWLVSVGPWADRMFLAILFVGLLGQLTFGSRGSWTHLARAMAIVGAVGLIALDQHRFQPWLYQFLLLFGLSCLLPPQRFLNYARFLLISLYAYSALGKFDYQFLHTVGQQFLTTFMQSVGIDISTWSPTVRIGLAAWFPVVELSIAAGLCFRRTMIAALLGSIAMHATLIGILGPWGMQQSYGVLMWNVFFIVQAIVWLWKRKWWSHAVETDHRTMNNNPSVMVVNSTEKPTFVRGWLARLLLGFAILFPLTERFGIADHWAAWALYSPHSSRVRMEVSAAALAGLPEDLVAITETNNERTPWIEVPLGRWSLDTLHAPIYPQGRFQLGVAIGLTRRLADDEIRVIELSAANRWTGRRVQRVLDHRAALEAAAKRYWLNVEPRRGGAGWQAEP